MRYLLLLLFLASCAARTPSSTTPVSTAERDAPLKKSEGAVSGLVRDAADGLPLSMVSVHAEQDGRIVAHDISDYKGRYRLGPLPPGHYRVTARFSRARVVYEGVVVHKSLETDVKIAMDLRPQGDRATVAKGEGSYGTIEGVILDEVDGRQFPGTVVSLDSKELDDAILAIADEEGRFRFRGLRPGIYNLSCYYHLVEQGNIEIRRGNIEVVPGETTAVQLMLDLAIRKR